MINNLKTMKSLESFGKETGFTVPDGYYDELYHKMMGKVAVEKQKTIHKKQILRFSLVSSAAAAVTLLITVNVIFKNGSDNSISNDNHVIAVVNDSSNVNRSAPMIAINQMDEPEQTQKVSNISSSKVYSEQSGSQVAKYDKPTDEASVLSVMEFYEDDARSDQFQETLMDLECYYDF
jgi:hypothetical protein